MQRKQPPTAPFPCPTGRLLPYSHHACTACTFVPKRRMRSCNSASAIMCVRPALRAAKSPSSLALNCNKPTPPHTPPPQTAAPVQTKKPIPISVPVPVQWQGLAGPPALTCSSVATAPWVSMGPKGKVKSEKACGSTHDPRGIHTTTTAPTKAARRGDHRRACSAMTQRVRSRSSGVCCLPFTHHSWWPSERTTAGKSKLR
jgi:hypothetical protein